MTDRDEEMVSRGQQRAEKNLNKALQRGDGASTPAGIALTKRAIAPVREHLEAFMEDANAGRAGRKHAAAVLLEGVDLELAAYLAVRGVINAAIQQYTVQTVAGNVARLLRNELMADYLDRHENALFKHIMRKANAGGRTARNVTKWFEQTTKQNTEIPAAEWTRRERILVGTKLVEAVAEGAGFVDLHLVKKSKKQSRYIVEFNDRSGEWFRQYNQATTLTRPFFIPTVVPPKPWEHPRSNPYHSDILDKDFHLVSRGHRVGQEDAMDQVDMGMVFDGLNAIQETPWRINKRVLTVMSDAWERGIELSCLPGKYDYPVPEMPEEVKQSPKSSPERQKWRVLVAPIWRRNAETTALRRELDTILAIAGENADEEKIYFPHRCDFRGRVYPMAWGVNPQSRDEARALLEFAEGKPLGHRGQFWLGVHGANLFGVDKVSLEERYRWAMNHGRHAALVAFDPLSNLWWTEADKPWCALAWCFEWAALGDSCGHEHDFVSHIPIALDGSCNGIQHFSAMLRDPIGGAAVNLTPSEKPQDIYGEVAKKVVARLQEHVKNATEEADMAAAWLQFGIDRKITKRSVMVLPYGGTYLSCMEYVREAVREKIKGGANDPFGDQLVTAEVFLASLVWNSISDVVIAARSVMEWLQKVSRVVSRENLPITWVSPSGFLVKQFYRKTTSRLIKTKFNGSITQFRLSEDIDEVDKARQANSIAPNFVHSMDAAAMMWTIQKCRRRGITSFAMIHDSYGTHAAYTDCLSEALREAFVEMYEQHDVLEELRKAVLEVVPKAYHDDIPPVPEMGTLDLREVLKSLYFFA